MPANLRTPVGYVERLDSAGSKRRGTVRKKKNYASTQPNVFMGVGDMQEDRKGRSGGN